ncbi:MAG TPA: hypothetical protein VJ765_03110 [Chitinophagaceae bacterium]|nr:hypothetical protein [Chitinophagaceae bacterium]
MVNHLVYFFIGGGDSVLKGGGLGSLFFKIRNPFFLLLQVGFYFLFIELPGIEIFKTRLLE